MWLRLDPELHSLRCWTRVNYFIILVIGFNLFIALHRGNYCYIYYFKNVDFLRWLPKSRVLNSTFFCIPDCAVFCSIRGNPRWNYSEVSFSLPISVTQSSGRLNTDGNVPSMGIIVFRWDNRKSLLHPQGRIPIPFSCQLQLSTTFLPDDSKYLDCGWTRRLIKVYLLSFRWCSFFWSHMDAVDIFVGATCSYR